MSSRSWRSIRRRRSSRRSGALAASLATLGLTACLYGFAGGGFAPHIKTVAILPFDNQTPEPALTQEVHDAVREALEGRLGLRLGGEGADALVRGRIARYDADMPVAVQAGIGQANVTKRQVQLTVDVEILDQREGKTLWQRQGLTVFAEYQPPREVEGRRAALQKLVNDIVDGAQSQW